MATKMAKFVKDISGFKGRVRLFECDPPMANEDGNTFKHVVVSELSDAFDTGRLETYIFASDEDGTVKDWGELPGSFRGDTDYEKALSDAGYEVVK